MAVTSNLFRQSNGVLCILWCTFLLFSGVRYASSAATKENCAAVKLAFHNRGIALPELPMSPVTDESATAICKTASTCCTSDEHSRLSTRVQRDLYNSLKDSLSKMAALTDNGAQRFDEFFTQLFNKSKLAFHEMFVKTYGTIYLQYSYIFTDLFKELEKYYNVGNVDLKETMDNFFIILYQRMFKVLNSQYEFDDKYLDCVSNHMKDLKPFGDVPHKLSMELKRSFVATRTFAKSLSTGTEVIKKMMSIKPSPECIRAITQMQYCSLCSGYTKIKSCSNYCINVMKGCLAYYADLDSEWNQFVEGFDKVAERLLGPFNIVMVVEPINVKISDAVMIFQDNGINISQRIYQGCGKPTTGNTDRLTRSIKLPVTRLKREDTNEDIEFESTDHDYVEEEETERSRRGSGGKGSGKELEFESLNFGNSHGDDGVDNWEDEEDEASQESAALNTLITDIKTKVKDSKHFWSHLPYQFCNNDNITESPSNVDHCWNGTSVNKYEEDVIGNGLAAQRLNKAVIVDTTKPNVIVNDQLFTLKTMTNKLRNAYNGMDVDWGDFEETIYMSGSGSGDIPDDTNDTEPDSIEDDFHEGSGSMEHGRTPSPPAPVPPEVHPEIVDNSIDVVYKTSRADSTSKPRMSLTRALVSYMFPLVVVWFGGMASDVARCFN